MMLRTVMGRRATTVPLFEDWYLGRPVQVLRRQEDRKCKVMVHC